MLIHFDGLLQTSQLSAIMKHDHMMPLTSGKGCMLEHQATLVTTGIEVTGQT